MSPPRAMVISLFLIFTFVCGILPPMGGEPTPPQSDGGRSRGTIVVNASGGGDYTHIQWAIDNASDGDTIKIHPGIYYENLVIDVSIQLVGTSKLNTIIDGQEQDTCILVLNDSVTIMNVNVINSGKNREDSGIMVSKNGKCIVRNCTINNHLRGIWLGGWRGVHFPKINNTIENNIISNNSFGILSEYSDYNQINNNSCFNNGIGISLNDSNRNIVVNNSCYQNRWYGISALASSNNNIVRNLVYQNNNTGISSYWSNSNSLINNTLSNNGNGIRLGGTKFHTLYNNKLENNGITLSDNDDLNELLTHTMDVSNLINGKPLYYWKNVTGGSIPSGAGQIILVNCSEVLVENQEIKNSSIGIFLGYSSRNTISRNKCSDNSNGIENCGIQLWYSDYNVVTENTFNSNAGDYAGHGIQLFFSNKNDISKNICNENDINGISIQYSNYNNVTNNTCNKNGFEGIYLYSSIINTISNSTFFSNELYAISINYLSEENTIFLNSFIDNNNGGDQAYDNGIGNKWNSSDKGNYWSDWNKPDTDSDGIIDTPYIIDSNLNSKDYYPLVAPPRNITPIADAGHSVIINQHEDVRFNSSNTIHRRLVINYTWSFIYDNINQSLYGPSPSFTFHTAGTYEVLLTVIGCFRQNSNDTVIVKVLDITYPIANAGNDTIIEVFGSMLFNASNSSDNVGISVYQWRFSYDNEERILFGETVSFGFDKCGVYVVTLNVRDEEGNSASDIINITVIDATAPIADAGENISIRTGETIIFDGTDSTDNVGIINYTWSFYYNRTDQNLYGSKSQFKFEIAGNFSVTLHVRDAIGLWDVDSIGINVIDNEKPNADAGEDVNINSNGSVHFQGNGSWDNEGIKNFTWTFEYNNSIITLYGSTPNFRFEIPGKYNVTLRVTDIEGNMGTDSLIVIVHPDKVIPSDDDDDVSPTDDDIDPTNDDVDPNDGSDARESGSGIPVWVWILLFFFIVAIITVLVFLIRNPNVIENEKSSEDYLGRVEKSEESEIEK